MMRFVETASAQDLFGLWQPACSPLQPGCGQGPANIFANSLPNLAVLMLQIATGLAVLFIVWAGVLMVLSMGDESKIAQQRQGMLYSVMGLFLAIISQLLVSFIVTHDWGQSGQGAAGDLPIVVIAAIVGYLLFIFNALLLLAIVYYSMRMLIAAGDSGQFNTAKTGITWAILGAIFVNLANALVQGVTSFFGL